MSLPETSGNSQRDVTNLNAMVKALRSRKPVMIPTFPYKVNLEKENAYEDAHACHCSDVEDNDGGSAACLNGPAGIEVKGNGKMADGMVYDATKGKTSAKPASNCTNSVAMGETEDDDGDEN